MSLSKRAQNLIGNPSQIVLGHIRCAQDPYSLQNPKGYLNFGTAENHLVSELLLPRLNSNLHHNETHIQYNKVFGTDEFRAVAASFFEKYLGLRKVNAENIVVQCGVSAICESLSYAMFDEDDILLIPTPYYTGFDHDFKLRFKVKFEYVHLNPQEDFTHQISLFEKAYAAISDKDRIKGVLITTPHNPTGEVLSDDFSQKIVSFCKEKKLSLISDEIYALSNLENNPHHSLFQLAIESGVDAHFLYGMAKDFALAGAKVGFYYSTNEQMIRAMQDLSYFHTVGTPTQLAIQKILGDHQFLDNFIPENQKRLKTIPLILQNQLSQLKFIAPKAGLFMLLDLSKWCITFEDEAKVFSLLLEKYKINLSPGKNLGLQKPGFFRVCFAQKRENVLELIIRLKEFSQNELNL